MRAILALAATVLAGSQVIDTAQAYTKQSYDPFQWCANYRGNRGGVSNCGFYTYEQCQATVSSNLGFCSENLFYTGPRKSVSHHRSSKRSTPR